MKIVPPPGLLSPDKSSERLAAADLIKGFLILLVIMDHTAIADGWQNSKAFIMLDHIEVPSFFVLAGYFFSCKRDFMTFLINKVNRLIVPLAFFITLLFAIDIIFCVTPQIQQFTFSHYLYCTLYGPVNYPLWFLRALFISSIIFYGIYHKIVHRTILAQTMIILFYSISIILLISVTLWNGINSRIEADLYYLNIACALMWVPFLWGGSIMGRFDLLRRSIKYPMLCTVMVLSYMTWHITAFDTELYLSPNSVTDITAFYICVVSGSIFIGAVARLVSWMPVINYLGQYSLIVLGAHAISIYILRAIGISNPSILLLTTCIMMIPAVELIRHHFPRYTAQRDLITISCTTKRFENG
ncbi:MAG: acyltransferase [Pseudoflavonifractor sp.]|nr:acyltransferase [Pseudoflavonifractor sp.]